MGWIDRLTATHRDRADLAASGFRRLPGLEKPGIKSIVSVDPGSIGAHDVGVVDVAVVGVEASRWHRAVAIAPSTLEAGLTLLTSAIVGSDLVRISLRNDTDVPLAAAARDWSVYVFTRRDT